MARGKGDQLLTEEIVEYMGSIFRAPKTEDGMLVCPVCSRYYFTTPEDLVSHIVVHARSGSTDVKGLKKSPRSEDK